MVCQRALKRMYSCMTMALMKKVQASAEQAWVLMKVMRKPKPINIITLVSCQAPYLQQKRVSAVMMASLSIIRTKIAKKMRISSYRTSRNLPKDLREASATVEEFIPIQILFCVQIKVFTSLYRQNKDRTRKMEFRGKRPIFQGMNQIVKVQRSQKYYLKVVHRRLRKKSRLRPSGQATQSIKHTPLTNMSDPTTTFIPQARYYDKKLDQVVAQSISIISMMPSSEFIYGRLSSIYRKNFQPMLYFKDSNCFQKRSTYSRLKTYMIHIELLIFYRLTHSNLPTFSPALSKTYSNSYGHFLVSWGSKYPKYPFLALRNKCAYRGVPPMTAKKQLDPIISVKVSRYSFSALSRPMRDMINMTMFSFSVLISLRKMELSLQTVTLQVRLKFQRARLMMNPASHGVYHQNSFLWGQRHREIQVSVCKENGISLLSQKRGAMVCNLACSLLKSRFAMAIWATRSMHPHPESDSQQVVGKMRLMLLRQVRRMYSQSSQTFLLEKKVSRVANIVYYINQSALITRHSTRQKYYPVR